MKKLPDMKEQDRPEYYYEVDILITVYGNSNELIDFLKEISEDERISECSFNQYRFGGPNEGRIVIRTSISTNVIKLFKWANKLKYRLDYFNVRKLVYTEL